MLYFSLYLLLWGPGQHTHTHTHTHTHEALMASLAFQYGIPRTPLSKEHGRRLRASIMCVCVCVCVWMAPPESANARRLVPVLTWPLTPGTLAHAV